MHRALTRGPGGVQAGCGDGVLALVAHERGGAAARGGGGPHAALGQEPGGLLRRAPQPVMQVQVLRGQGEPRRQVHLPRPLRHRRGGGAVHRALTGRAGGGGEGSLGARALPHRRGGAAAGARGGVGAARGRQQGGLLRRVPQPEAQDQGLRGAGEPRGQGRVPRQLRHARGGTHTPTPTPTTRPLLPYPYPYPYPDPYPYPYRYPHPHPTPTPE